MPGSTDIERLARDTQSLASLFFESQCSSATSVSVPDAKDVRYDDFANSLQMCMSDSYVDDFHFYVQEERRCALQFPDKICWNILNSEEHVLEFIRSKFALPLPEFANAYVGLSTSPVARWTGTWPSHHSSDAEVRRTKASPHRLSYGRMFVLYASTGQRIAQMERTVINKYIADSRMVNISRGGETSQHDVPTFLYFCFNDMKECAHFWRLNRLRVNQMTPRPLKRRRVEPRGGTPHPFAFAT